MADLPSSYLALPLVVGICGEIPSEGDAARARATVLALFVLLDQHYPSSPKVLVSTLDNNFARIAAIEAAARTNWRVSAPIASNHADFLAGLGDDHRAWWQTFVARENVTSFTLAPLMSGHSEAAEAQQSIAERHLEQARLFVAGHAHLLIHSEEPPGSRDAHSGKRMLDYKLSATTDDVARDIIGRSTLLLSPATLDDISIGPVWQIAAGGRTAGVLDNVRILGSEGVVGLDLVQGDRFEQSIPLARRLDEFNNSLQQLPKRTATQRNHPTKHADDASATLRAFSDSLSAVLVYSQRRFRRVVWILPLLFLAAAGFFELWLSRSEIPFGQLGLSLYAIATCIGIYVYWTSSSAHLQTRAEEYRAIVEALRVQAAWWDNGLTDAVYRADQYYLAGARESFRLVRYAIHGLVNAATVMGAFAKPDPAAHLVWIETQIEFFAARIDRRKRSLAYFERTSWLAFVGGLMFAAAALGVQALNDWGATSLPAVQGMSLGPIDTTAYEDIEQVQGQHVAPIVAPIRRIPAGDLIFFGLFGSVIFILIGAWALAGLTQWARVPWLQGAVVLLLVVLVFLLGMADLLKIAAPHLRFLDPVRAETHKWDIGPRPLLDLLAGCATLCAAVVASTRYVMEKFSWRAEMHSYDEALAIFQRAKSAIAAIDASGARPADREKDYRQVVFAAGKQALAENERWLREHRERPLEPVFST
jgi:hypothetical protein